MTLITYYIAIRGICLSTCRRRELRFNSLGSELWVDSTQHAAVHPQNSQNNEDSYSSNDCYP